MVGLVSEVVIPVKKVEGGRQVFTIVCEVVDSGPHHPNHHHHHPQDATPLTSRLWKMASAWRVISFFVVVFVLPTVLISLPLYARYHLYHARHLPMTETDTRALNYAVSSFWCQGQRVASNGSLDAFLLPGEPKLKREKRHVSLRRKLTLQHDDIEYWGVYLLEGSSFSVSSLARWPGGVLLVVQGEENLRKCFYRESRVQEELNNPGPVYKSPMENEPEDDRMPEESRKVVGEEVHWQEEEEEDAAREVFDDFPDVPLQREKKGQMPQEENGESVLKVEDAMTEIKENGFPQVPEEEKHVLAHRPNRKYNSNGKAKVRRKGGKKRKSRRKEDESDTEHGRLSRTLLNRQKRDQGHAVELNEHLTQDEALDILYQMNGTFLEEGESSYSSSEEFMENCRNSILMVELNARPNWESYITNNSTQSPDSWTFAANSSDYFYFIFTSDNTIEKNQIGFELDMYRSTYDVSSPLETCRNVTECVFPLTFTQSEAVVVEVPAAEHLKELHSFEVTTTCQPRVPVYMVFILMVPFIILLFAFQ